MVRDAVNLRYDVVLVIREGREVLSEVTWAEGRDMQGVLDAVTELIVLKETKDEQDIEGDIVVRTAGQNEHLVYCPKCKASGVDTCSPRLRRVQDAGGDVPRDADAAYRQYLQPTPKE